jgi:hypothetical protein
MISANPRLPEPARLEPTLGGAGIPGMTLRDWIAGQVISAMISSDAAFSGMRDKNGQHCELDKSKLNQMAKNSYQAADAMLLARAASAK